MITGRPFGPITLWQERWRLVVHTELYTLQQEQNTRLQSLEAELRQCRCHESRLIDEYGQANTAISADCLKVAELEKLVDRQAHQLNSLNAEIQVNSCSL